MRARTSYAPKGSRGPFRTVIGLHHADIFGGQSNRPSAITAALEGPSWTP